MKGDLPAGGVTQGGMYADAAGERQGGSTSGKGVGKSATGTGTDVGAIRGDMGANAGRAPGIVIGGEGRGDGVLNANGKPPGQGTAFAQDGFRRTPRS